MSRGICVCLCMSVCLCLKIHDKSFVGYLRGIGLSTVEGSSLGVKVNINWLFNLTWTTWEEIPDKGLSTSSWSMSMPGGKNCPGFFNWCEKTHPKYGRYLLSQSRWRQGRRKYSSCCFFLTLTSLSMTSPTAGSVLKQNSDSLRFFVDWKLMTLQ